MAAVKVNVSICGFITTIEVVSKDSQNAST